MDRSWMPTAAGILNIVAGVMSLLGALALVFVGTVMITVPEVVGDAEAELVLGLVAGLIWAMVLLCLLAGVLSIVGGIVALRRTGWAWPLTGAITALFSFLPLGVFALIFVVMAERELRGAG